jgi:membrane associated rhomboid family serine protease
VVPGGGSTAAAVGAAAATVATKPKRHPLWRIHYNAPVTLTFALLALAVLGLAQLTGGSSNFWFSASRASWSDPTTYLRLFTHVLGHANWQHYFGNIMMILLLGPILEEKYGSRLFATMIVITALVTGLLHILFTPTGILGASGVVFMMILLASITNMQAGRIPLTLIFVLVLYLGQEVVTWVTTDTNIAHSAHIIGGLCGAVFGYLFDHQKPSKPQKLSRRERKSLVSP